jgi:hypothetical protein
LTSARGSPSPAAETPREEPDQRLLEEYKIQIQSLANHYTRLWTRFNFFLTIHTALLISFVGLFRGRDLTAAAIPIPALGVLMSVVWYLIGAQDRYLVAFYRKLILHAARRLAPEDKRWPHLGIEVPEAVGMLAEADREFNRTKAKTSEEDEKKRAREDAELLDLQPKFFQWRSTPLSVTRFPAQLPVLIGLLWSAATVWVTIEVS